MITAIKLLGGTLLVGSMAVMAMQQTKSVKRMIATVGAWQSLLDGMRHEISSTGMTLSGVVERLEQDAGLQSALLGGRDASLGQGSARERFDRLCRTAASLLPADAAATPLLFTLGETFDTAISEAQITQRLDALLAALRSLEQEGQTQLARDCRTRAVLYICGGLCAVLMLW